MEAAKCGYLEVLKWLRANGCPWDHRACYAAAWNGHLGVLRWLHANGCPWTGRACSGAVHGGHLELLQWLRINGCPWDTELRLSSARGIDLAVLKWAIQNGCNVRIPDAMNILMGRTAFVHNEAVRWFHVNHPTLVPWAQSWLEAVNKELTAHVLPDVTEHIVEKYI